MYNIIVEFKAIEDLEKAEITREEKENVNICRR